MSFKGRLVQLFGLGPGGAPDPLQTDGSGALLTSGGGGGGGGSVTQGAGAATSSSPWWVALTDALGTPLNAATAEQIDTANSWLEQIRILLNDIAGTVALQSSLGSLDAKFPAASALSGTFADSIVTTLLGGAMFARDENANRFLRVSLDPNTRALNVRCYPRTVITVRGSNNGTGSSAAWGRRLSVAAFGVSLARFSAVYKGASDVYLFVKDKATAIANGDSPSYAPRRVVAGCYPTSLELIYTEDGFSNGIQLGLSTTADVYTEIGADDGFFECSRI